MTRVTKHYSDQELISNVYRAGTDGCDVAESIWSVCVLSPMVPATSVIVHAPNVSTAKRIAKQYAWRILQVPAATAPTAERLS